MHSELHDSSEPQGGSGTLLPNVTFTASGVLLNAFRPAGMSPAQFQVKLKIVMISLKNDLYRMSQIYKKLNSEGQS